MKEGEIDMLDNIWKREVGFRQAVTQIAEATGKKPPRFEDHTPFSNRGMEDLLELNELKGQRSSLLSLTRP